MRGTAGEKLGYLPFLPLFPGNLRAQPATDGPGANPAEGHAQVQLFPENFEKIACVGCGRCILYCPVNFDIRQAIQEIKNY